MRTSAEVGFDAGWRAEFRPSTPGAGALPPVRAFGRGGYEATIAVEDDAAFRAATFTLAVDGIRTQDLDAITAGRCRIVSLAVGWRDRPGSIGAALVHLASATGLVDDDGGTPVLRGRVQQMQRTVAGMRHRTTFTGIDATWALLAATPIGGARVPTTGSASDRIQALVRIADPALEVVAEGPPALPEGTVEVRATDTVLAAIRRIADAAYPSSEGRPPLLLRGERMHVGTWERSVRGGATHDLDASAGLVEAIPEPFEHAQGLDDPYAPVVADAYRLLLLGRADIRVGDLARVAIPEAGAGIGGALSMLTAAAGAAQPREFRIVGVAHALGPEIGFTTTLRIDAVRAGPARPAASGEEHRIAERLDRRIALSGRAQRTIDVGVVTRQSTEAAEPWHAQRVGLRTGLDPAALAPNLPVTAALARPAGGLVDKPYLTPFAFGRTGLVVPHYPGTRVLHLDYDGEPHSAVVAGALWEAGSEPASQPGDWWLSLPIGVQPVDESDEPRAAPSGQISSDLTDATGRRSLRVRGFEITVGTDNLPDVGERVMEAADDTLVIKGAAGNARIEIASNGAITIATDEQLTIRAKKIVLQGTDGVEAKRS